jgi:FHA domain
VKRIVERAKQISRSVAVGIRRAVDPPLDEHATPLDIRHAIVESIERRVQPAGRGRRILPDVHVKVKVLAADTSAQRALRTVLDDVHDVVATRLRELKCEVPAAFRVEVAYVKSRPASWALSQRMAVEYPEQPPIDASTSAVQAPLGLELTVLKGVARKRTYSFADAVVRIGRSDAPVDDRGKVRHNDVAFLEDDDERNKTVTRGHCEIRYNRATREYRIFDERSANGTRIVRAGDVIEVPARDPIGVAIASGDELQFGKAAVRVTIVVLGR